MKICIIEVVHKWLPDGGRYSFDAAVMLIFCGPPAEQKKSRFTPFSNCY